MKFKVIYPEKAWESPCKDSSLPYDWVPVALNADRTATLNKALPPIWHDGSNHGQKDLLSGEIRITLTTRSPTIVGNHQVLATECQTLQVTAENRCEVKLADALKQLDQDKQASVASSKPNKKFLFPLRLPESVAPGSPVLIPGESIRAAVKHCYSALLSSPLERVNEMSASRRPNQTVPGAPSGQTRPQPAVVMKYDAESRCLEVKLLSANLLTRLEFVRVPTGCNADIEISDARKGDVDKPISKDNNKVRKASLVVETDNNRRIVRRRWVTTNSDNKQDLTRDFALWLNYHFGVTGPEGYALDFGGKPLPHPSVIVPLDKSEAADHLKAPSVIVPKGVVRQFQKTGEHLSSRLPGSHWARSPQKNAKTTAFPTLKRGDLIFCEIFQPNGAAPVGTETVVVSFGHNFRYRWLHANSPTEVVRDYDTETGEWTLERRPEVRAHPDERPADADVPSPPSKLTATRNLFGFAAMSTNPAFGNEQGTGRLLDLNDPYNRLAGRVSFNFALERNATASDNDRFVNADRGRVLFLHPSASPKPMHDRSYVPGDHTTWGMGLLTPEADGLGLVPGTGDQLHVIQGGTELFAGRKFYLHQFSLPETGKTSYGPIPQEHYDLGRLAGLASLGYERTTAVNRVEMLQHLWKEHSAMAVDVTREGREFGLTVRFRNLRKGELAGLLACIEPDLLAEGLLNQQDNSGLTHKLRHTFAHLRQKRKLLGDRGLPWYGHKIGHSKASGMGSVSLKIDAMVQWGKDPQADVIWGRTHMQSLVALELPSLLNDTTTAAWLRALQFVHTEPDRLKPLPYLLMQHQPQNAPLPLVIDPIKWSSEERKRDLANMRAQGFAPATPAK